MENRKNEEEEERSEASASKFRSFKSNIKSKSSLPPPAAVFAKADADDEEEDVDDYMSNEILSEITDVRPGLIKSKATLRKYETEKRTKEKNEENRAKMLAGSSKALERTNRDEALSKSSLDPSNVGFKLMQKMGFKPGEALGSTTSQPQVKRLIEPIKVEIKADREGLGKDVERKKKLAEIDELRKRYHELRKVNEVQATRSYLEHKRNKFQLRKLVHNIHKCQRICYQLDSDNGLKSPEVKWYWPLAIRRHMKVAKSKLVEPAPETKVAEEADSVQKKQDEEEIVEMIDVRQDQVGAREEDKPLREVNIRKVYEERLQVFINEPSRAESKPEPQRDVDPTTCGRSEQEESNESDNDIDSRERRYFREQFAKEKAKSDSEDLSDKEAGRGKKRAKDDDSDDDDDEEEENDENDEQILSTKIDALCLYLREKYSYCAWCAVRYESEAALSESCPGLREDDHED